jgi:O-antigen ligase
MKKYFKYPLFTYFFVVGVFTIPFQGVRLIASLTISDQIFVLGSLCFLLEYILAKRWEWNIYIFNKYLLVTLFMIIGGALATYYSEYPSLSLITLTKILFLFSIWASMGLVFAKYTQMLSAMIIALIAGSTISSFTSIIDKFFGTTTGAYLYMYFNFSNSVRDTSLFINGIYSRYCGTMGHPNIMGLFTTIVFTIFFNIFLGGHLKKWRYRVPELILLCVLIYSVILTGSLSSIGTLVVSIIISLLYRMKVYRWKAIIPAGFTVFAFVGLVALVFINTNNKINFQGQNVNLDRVLSITGPERFMTDKETIEYILKRPIVGYGLDQAANELDANDSITDIGVHNTLLRAWLAGGIFSLLGLSLAYLIAFKNVFYSFTNIFQSLFIRDLAIGFSIAFLCVFIADMVQPTFIQRHSWLPAVLLYGIVIREKVQRRVETHSNF